MMGAKKMISILMIYLMVLLPFYVSSVFADSYAGSAFISISVDDKDISLGGFARIVPIIQGKSLGTADHKIGLLLAISNVDVMDIKSNSAEIRWNTGNESDSRVSYGKTAALGSVDADYSMSRVHSVKLANLEGNSLYYFSVISSDGIETVTDDNDGAYHNFTTAADTTKPYIAAYIPKYSSSSEINIAGDVEAGSKVKLYVDDMGSPIRVLDSSETSGGKFSFNGIKLQQENKIRISARDPSGNENSADYNITVDDEKPVLEISEIPSFAFGRNMTLRCNVSEQSNISVYLTRTTEDDIPPAKIAGLKLVDSGSNLIEIEWNSSQEQDFDQYLVYRDDVGILATTHPADYSSFVDIRVNSSSEYTYRVSAIDKGGNEGEKSDPLTATSLEGGHIDIVTPQPIELESRVETGMVEELNTTGAFLLDLRFDDGDGVYHIKIEAKDKAGNTALFESSTILDTTPPKIKILSPRNNERIYENFADDVTIEGETDPNSVVHLWVQRTPFGYLNKSIEISGLLNDIEVIDESKLDAKCRFEMSDGSYCDTGSDFSTVSDSTGYFRFEHVDLTDIFGGSIEATMVPPGDRYVSEYMNKYYNEFGQTAIPIESDLLFISTGIGGQRAAEVVSYNIVTCWSGNMSWDIAPIQEYQSPTFLSTERIAEGTETIYFLLNFSYRGYGSEPIVNSVSFSKACDNYIKNSDPKYNVSCQIMPSSCVAKSNQERTLWYVACHLGAYKDFNRFMENDWKDFMKAISSEMIFPFQVRISYSHKIDGNTTPEVQTLCEPLAYVVDNSKINFKEVLPDWLLYDAVDWINDTIEVLDDVMDKIYTVLEYVAIGCVASFVIKFVLTVYRRFQCYWDGFQDSVKKIAGTPADKQEGEQACPFGVKNLGVGWEQDQNKLTNAELEIDCDKCAAAWKLEASLYTAYRWLCDRVFCHSAPAKWTQNVDDPQLEQKAIEELRQCGEVEDKSLFGQTLIEAKCSGFKEDYLQQDVVDNEAAGNKCYRASVKQGNTQDRLVFVRSKSQLFSSDKFYEFKAVSAQSQTIGRIDRIWAKEIGDRYYTARVETCEELCKQKGMAAYACGNSQACINLGGFVEGNSDAAKERQTAYKNLGTVNSVSGRNFTFDPNKKYGTRRYGYTSDCVFGNTGPEAVTLDPNPSQTGSTLSETDECCCVSQGSVTDTGEYYMMGDQSSSKYCTEGARSGPVCEVFEEAESGTLDYPKFNYRYNHIKYKTAGNNSHTGYNPNRYVSGRDLPACFGFNSFLTTGKKLRNDPYKDHIAAFQCVCISGIYNRLQAIKNILGALQACLIQVRTTGTADAGVCKELFSQWVCGLVWNMIVMMQDGCMPWDSWGKDENVSDMQAVMQGGTQALVGGVGESLNELSEEYGGTVAANLLGENEEAVARKVCLAAFGYDWEISMKDIIDVAYQTPFATLVQPMLPFREYLSFDPFNGWSSYEYRAAWIINPGCNFDDYDVYLSCVSNKEIYEEERPGIDCTEQGDPEGSNCDCIGLEKEQVRKFYDGKRLSQNVLEDKDYHEVISAPFRYDHLKFVLRARRDINNNITPSCFPEGYFDEKQNMGVFYFPIKDRTARDVAACYVDVTSGMFQCLSGESFWGEKGNAYIQSVKMLVNNSEAIAKENEELQFTRGDPLAIKPTIWRSEGKDQCMRITLESAFEGYKSIIEAVDVEGVHEYGPIRVVDSLDIGRSRVSAPSGVTVRIDSAENVKEVNWAVGFEDGNNDSEFTINSTSDDLISVENTDKKKVKDSGLFKNGGLFLEKKDEQNKTVRIQITGVKLEKSVEGNVTTVSRISGNIIVAPPGDFSERKTVTLELFHLKDLGEQQYYSSIDDCNINDPVKYQNNIEKKVYKIKVVPKPSEKEITTSAQRQAAEDTTPPNITLVRIGGKLGGGPYKFEKNADIKIEVTVEDKGSGLKSLDIYVDNSKVDSLTDVGEAKEGTYTYFWNVGTVDHLLEIKVVNNNGLEATSGIKTIEVA